jgi:hypothetical protein
VAVSQSEEARLITYLATGKAANRDNHLKDYVQRERYWRLESDVKVEERVEAGRLGI